MSGENSQELMNKARQLMPGGVSSPIRAFSSVGGNPPVMQKASGAYIYDEDGREYIDCVLAYGPHILGHNHPKVVSAIERQLQKGTAFGATSAAEIRLAAQIVEAVPSIEMVRFVNSGTEATMSAIRLARAATGRAKIVKCTGGYHGHNDSLLAKAGSAIADGGLPATAGVLPSVTADTIVIPYNDDGALAEKLIDLGSDVAAVIVEPIAGNIGCVLPQPNYLQKLRNLTANAGALLIFDEVMSGFRVSYGGAQELYGVQPDITCLGKVIGAGLPVAAYGGSQELMSLMAPAGPVFQAGTLSGNPLAMVAGSAALEVLSDRSFYDYLEQLGQLLEDGLREVIAEAQITASINRLGSMLTLFLGVESVGNFDEAEAADTKAFARLHKSWMEAGIFWPPSQFESAFLSAAHTESDIQRVVEATRNALVPSLV